MSMRLPIRCSCFMRAIPRLGGSTNFLASAKPVLRAAPRKRTCAAAQHHQLAWRGVSRGPGSHDYVRAFSGAPSDASDEKPWFLEEELPRQTASLHKPNLPTTPDDAPSMLESLIKYIYEDMGLDDLALFDLRELDPPAALGPNLFMVFGTARSERHLHIASGRVVRWLRQNYRISARADGLIGPGELKTKLRRIRKKAKVMGKNTMLVPSGDHGILTGWVCVNFTVNDNEGEGATSPGAQRAKFDEAGRFSGFGVVQTGTTVVVQCMTESRRGGVDLEQLWLGILRRSLEKKRKIRGEGASDKSELDVILQSKAQLPVGSSALQWLAMQRASQQQRHFSTARRRLQSEVGSWVPVDDVALRERAMDAFASQTSLHDLPNDISQLQVCGTDITESVLRSTISTLQIDAFRARRGGKIPRGSRPAAPHRSGTRLEGVDETLVKLIVGVLQSPAHDSA